MALESLECCPPPARPGGKLVIDVPGLTPTAPPRVDEPVLVTAEPPNTEYPSNAPRVGEVAASGLAIATREGTARTSARIRMMAIVRNLNLCMVFGLPPKFL
jgi:hypothetical protein